MFLPSLTKLEIAEVIRYFVLIKILKELNILKNEDIQMWLKSIRQECLENNNHSL